MLTLSNLGYMLGDRWLWRGVTLTLHPGESVGIVGPSGSGKTVLFRTIVGLEPIAEGDIVWKNRPLSQWHIPRYRQQVCYLPQRPIGFEGTVSAHLQQVMQLGTNRSRSVNWAEVQDWLSILGRSSDFLERPIDRLSGGEGQVLSLIRALLIQPTVLLLDEPTASLDQTTTLQVEKLLSTWRTAQTDRACLWTSHDETQLHRVTDRQFSLADAVVRS